MLNKQWCRDKIKGFQEMEDVANAIAASREAYQAIYRPETLEALRDKATGKTGSNVLGFNAKEG